MSAFSPFSKEELLPQSEMLEIKIPDGSRASKEFRKIFNYPGDGGPGKNIKLTEIDEIANQC